jgi:cellulose 1,4-beta-cellobiosidase
MMRWMLLVLGVSPVTGQLAGIDMIEGPPPVDVAHCTKIRGCVLEEANATLDAHWRWIHGKQCYGEQCWSSGNCYTGDDWDKEKCPDPKTCAENCVLEGVTEKLYDSTYGVKAIKGGVELKFMSGQNVGSRLYLTHAGGEKYKLFKLKNREFSFDVDVSTLACGINGAVYFSEMEADGGKAGRNKAGAKYGTGYCDAQCPHDVKFMKGDANIIEWNSTTHFGKYGACCAEMDIWEANRAAEALTTHPCNITGTHVCTGIECGGKPDEFEHRYKGVCDKDGCDFNPYRDGDADFFGEGSKYAVNTEKPFTIVTQWITSDGTDSGDLTEIRRLYVQDGKIIKNSAASILPGSDSKDVSITDEYCDAQKAAFGDPNQHKAKGGLKAMGEALDRGMVLVLSLWDDSISRMLWLDSYSGDASLPGNARGPCKDTSGSPDDVRGRHADASVKYYNLMYGEIDSTYTAPSSAKPAAAPARSTTTTPPPSVPDASSSVQVVADASASPIQQQQSTQTGPTAAFSQCGGLTWTGPTTCPGQCKCVKNGDYYSQCTPPTGAWQCGGEATNEIITRVSIPARPSSETRAWVGSVASSVVIGTALGIVMALTITMANRVWRSGRRTRLYEDMPLILTDIEDA